MFDCSYWVFCNECAVWLRSKCCLRTKCERSFFLDAHFARRARGCKMGDMLKSVNVITFLNSRICSWSRFSLTSGLNAVRRIQCDVHILLEGAFALFAIGHILAEMAFARRAKTGYLQIIVIARRAIAPCGLKRR